MRKGALVKLDADCFTVENGGTRRYPLTNGLNDERGTIDGFFFHTEEEMEKLSKLDYYRGLDDAGESRLIPREGHTLLYKDKIYTVLRARCRAIYNWRMRGGLTKVLDTETGKEIYVSRKYLKVIA